jgi:glutathione reductase (NADPH)
MRARRHLRQRRLHPEEAVQLRRPLRRELRGSARLRLERRRSRFDWETLKANRRVEIGRLNGVYGDLLTSARRDPAARPGARRRRERGRGRRRRHRAERIVVATGGWPVPADVPGGERAISSNEIFDLARFPARLAVVGGGYIASEFASIFNGLGARVTQLYRGEQILRGFDRDIRDTSPPR